MSTKEDTDQPRVGAFTAAEIKELALGSIDRVALDNVHTARIIAALDHEENLMHVQFTSLEDGKTLSKPVLWNKRDWDTNYELHLAKKKRYAEERLIDNINSENIKRAAKIWQTKFHLSPDAALETARIMIHIQKNYELLEAIGVYIERPPGKK